MQHPRWWLVFLVGLLANPMPDRARAETMTETDLLARLNADPTLRAATEAEAAAARARAATAGQLTAPTISFSREDSGDAGVEQTWAARWTPPWASQRRHARGQAEAEIAQAESRGNLARLGLRDSLRAAYADWALATERQQLAEGYRADIERLVTLESARADAGEIPGLSVRRLALAGQRITLRANRFAVDTRLARGRLEALVGPLPDAAVPVMPTLPPQPTPRSASAEGEPSRDEAASDAQAMDREHPQSRAAAAAAERDRFAVARARSAIALPEIELGWRRVRADGLTADGPVLGAAWRVPLPGRRRAKVAAAEAVAAGSAARQARQEAMAIAVRSAAQDVYAQHHAQASTLPEPDDRLRQASVEAYRLGEGSLTDLLDTFEALHAAAMGRLDLLADALAAHRALEQAVGHSLPLVSLTHAASEMAPSAPVPPAISAPDLASLETKL